MNKAPIPPLADPRTSTLSRDDLELAVYQWGQPDGRPVILQHGFAASALINWVTPGIVADLVSAGRWVVALDARGHGKSSPVHDPGKLGHQTAAHDIRALIDFLHAVSGPIQHVDFAGYSMGGFIGMHLIGMEPRVRRAVIAAVGAAAGPASVAPVSGAPEISRSTIADAMEAVLNDPSIDPKAIEQRDARDFVRYAKATGGDLRSLAAHMRAKQTTPVGIESAGCEVLVLAGTDDHLARSAELLARAIPKAIITRTLGTHLSAVAEPEFRLALRSFLCD